MPCRGKAHDVCAMQWGAHNVYAMQGGGHSVYVMQGREIHV